MQPKCSCGGHFIEPSELGFDSDGSVLICDGFKKGKACTNWIKTVERSTMERLQRKARTERQGKIIKSIIVVSHFLAAIPFFFGLSLWNAFWFAPFIAWDIIMLKDSLNRQKQKVKENAKP
jgi:hypothetical protein